MIGQVAKARIAALLVGAISTSSARAVLFFSTNDTNYNTTAPSGTLTNSGWQYQGFWNTSVSVGKYLGTPIAPTYFITAKHVGGTVGDIFTLNGFTYHTTASFADPNSDLRIWKVAETFPAYASLYTATDEVGKPLVVFGRGTQRGSEVIVSGQTNGWFWGADDSVQRWGENEVADISDGGPFLGDLIAATFDGGAGPNEAHLSRGDSGGAVFIQDGSTWKLAGINYSVSGSFSNAADGTVFSAALYDMGGLYIGGGTNWTLIPDQMADIPSAFFSTRISANVNWINSVIDFLPGNDLGITATEHIGADVRVSFLTGTNRLYRVERRNDLVTGTWTTLTNNVAGTGGIVSVTDPNAASLPKRFYRIGFMP